MLFVGLLFVNVVTVAAIIWLCGQREQDLMQDIERRRHDRTRAICKDWLANCNKSLDLLDGKSVARPTCVLEGLPPELYLQSNTQRVLTRLYSNNDETGRYAEYLEAKSTYDTVVAEYADQRTDTVRTQIALVELLELRSKLAKYPVTSPPTLYALTTEEIEAARADILACIAKTQSKLDEIHPNK